VALDQSFIGRSYPPTSTYEVSRAKIREFVDAIGDSNPVYRDPAAARAAGHPDVIAPPTFITVVNIPAVNAVVADPALGLDYTRMVHGLQSFTYVRPVCAGDTLALTVTIDDIMDRAGNDFLTVRAEVAGEGGELICTTSAQLVVRRGDEA
jgi:acyl dehydratase